MKIAVTGPNGRVGKFMVEHHGLVPLFVDITDPQKLAKALDKERPDVVLHAAGYSDPDFCEDPKNREAVIKVNYWGSINVFREASERRIITVFLSTSQIFSGRSFLWFTPPKYKEEDWRGVKPVNFYAMSKLTVEAASMAYKDRVKIVRTSHLFDYPRMMDKLTGDVTVAPTFIKRSYSYLPHFARSLKFYLWRVVEMPRIVHIAGTDTVSEYDLLRAFVKVLKFNKYKIRPRRYEMDVMAPRPHFSGLDVSLSKKLQLPQFSYMDGLKEMDRTIVRG